MRISDWSSDVCSSDLANGVILITTKRGQTGKPQLTYDFNFGLQQPTRIPEMSDAAEYATIRNELQIFDNLPVEEWGAAWEAFNTGEGTYDRNSGGNIAAVYTPEQMQKFRSEEHTTELQSLMRKSYAVF